MSRRLYVICIRSYYHGADVAEFPERLRIGAATAFAAYIRQERTKDGDPPDVWLRPI